MMKNEVINVLMIFMLIFISAASAQSSLENANTYHGQALNDLTAGKIAEAESLFFYSAREYSYAPSYFELAKIEFKKNTVYSRQKARDYIQKAIWKDPDNIEFRFLQAKLMEIYSSSMAFDVYEGILDIDPHNTEALFNLGRISEDDFYEYHNSFMNYGTESDAALSYNNYAYKKYLNAVNFFVKAIKSNPGRSDSYMHLSILLSEAGKFENGITLLTRVVHIDSLNKNAWSFLGYLYYKTQKFDSCQSAYKKALGLMTEKERKEFTDSTTMMILGEEKMDPAKIDKTVNDYWNRKDPLLLTKYNERLLEHYSRIVYSDVMFSVVKQKVTGWKSDRGEIMVRYGEPLNRIRLRPYINAGGKTQLMLKTDIWTYKNKTFGFTDDYFTSNFRFSVPNDDGRQLSQFSYDTDSYIKYLRRTDPEDYEPEFKGPVFTLPYAVTQFKDLNNDDNRNTQVYVNYALDISDNFESGNKFSLPHQSGLFITDSSNNKTGQQVEEFTYVGNERELKFSPSEKYWVNSLEIETKPDSVSLAFEVVRKNDGGVSTNHFPFLVKDFDNSKLNISDIVLASGIDKPSSGKYSLIRNNLGILPNPTQTFTRNTDIFLYYEVYNLKQDQDQRANFEQKITLSKVKENSFIEDILSSLSGLFTSKHNDEITLTTDYQSSGKNAQIYLQMDMSKYQPGDYIIKVTIDDKLAGIEKSSQTLLKWR